MRQWLVMVMMMVLVPLQGQGEGGVFTPQRLAAIKTGEGALGNNPSAINWFNDLRNKAAKLGGVTTLGIDDITGSVYPNEQFLKGTIYYRYTPYGDFDLRYDAFNDEVELKRASESEVEALHKNAAISCTIDGEHYYYIRYRDTKEAVNEGYLILLYKGVRYTLYIRRSKLFKDGKPAKTSLQNSFPPRFVDDENYFLSSAGELPVQIKTSKKSVLGAIQESDRAALKHFIKHNKIVLSDVNDLQRAIQFADQLKE